ncbi:carbohydrate kinase [bacterium]|nr:MAG: carbohydrate kinase [bacterium]
MVAKDPSYYLLGKSIELWKGKKIVILGDMILDEFIYGTAVRVSREAPVVIVRYDSTSYSPGGAANAVQNIVAMGGRAFPVGVIGKDEDGRILRELFEKRGVSHRGLIGEKTRATVKKIRVMAGEYHAQKQQVVRIDKEDAGPVDKHLEEKLLRRFRVLIARGVDAVLLSDYNQGIFSDSLIKEVMETTRDAGVPTVVDSRFRLNRFVGVTTATPNELEAARAVGFDGGQIDIEKVGRILLKKLKSKSLIITRGRLGMFLFEPRRRARSVNVVGSQEATDVTGAGDTVSSAVALSLAAHLDMVSAMELANIAASIVVMKRGVSVATIDEIRSRLQLMDNGNVNV